MANLEYVTEFVICRAPAASPNSICCSRKRASRTRAIVEVSISKSRRFFFPKKLPPLVLTSKPEPVRDIWGFYNYKKNGALGSTVLHVLAIAAIIGFTILGRSMVQKITKPAQTVELIAPGDIPPLPPSKTVAGGGGGGGDRDKFQAPKAKLPKFAMEQVTPPAVVVRNEAPKLVAEPTVVCLRKSSLPATCQISAILCRPFPAPPSNGTGFGGGIGSGSGGGVGSGEGPGVGPGKGGDWWRRLPRRRRRECPTNPF